MGTSGSEAFEANAPDAADELMRLAQEMVGSTLQQIAQWQQTRAAQLTAAAERLQGTLRREDPRVAALRRSAEAANAFQNALKVGAVRVGRMSTVAADEWVVLGRVSDEKGAPLSGLQVHLIDRDPRHQKLLRDAKTDENGEFAVRYRTADFAPFRDPPPEILVTVTDAAGKVLDSSREPLHFDAGRAEYFEFSVSGGTSGRPKSKRQPGRAPKE